MLFLAFMICILYLKSTLNAKLLTFQEYLLKEKQVNSCPFDAWILNLDRLLNSGLNSGLNRGLNLHKGSPPDGKA